MEVVREQILQNANQTQEVKNQVVDIHNKIKNCKSDIQKYKQSLERHQLIIHDQLETRLEDFNFQIEKLDRELTAFYKPLR